VNVLQYFSYIVAVSFIGGGNHRPVASHWQTLSHNVVSSIVCKGQRKNVQNLDKQYYCIVMSNYYTRLYVQNLDKQYYCIVIMSNYYISLYVQLPLHF
jgi:hypothetical protein